MASVALLGLAACGRTGTDYPADRRSEPSTKGTLVAERNKAIVVAAFNTWVSTGAGVFDILAEDVCWTIAGSAPSARTFAGRADFLRQAVDPLSVHFAGPIRPTVRGIFADGETVVVHWDGVAAMKDGQTYRNSYAWFFRMREGKVREATAFLDLPTYDAALAGRRLPAWPSNAGPGEKK